MVTRRLVACTRSAGVVLPQEMPIGFQNWTRRAIIFFFSLHVEFGGGPGIFPERTAKLF
jgi:hypothetical protein